MKSPTRWLDAMSHAGSGYSPGYARMAPLLLVGGAAAFLASIGRLGVHTDAPSVFANSLCCGWLALALAGIFLGRQLGLTRWMVVVCVVLGLLRAVVALLGAPQGWVLTQTIEVGERSATSQTHVAELRFDAGDAPAHLINNKRQFNFHGDRDDEPERSKLPVAVTARAYVAGHGAFRISSSSPVSISIGSEVINIRPPIINHEQQFSLTGEEAIEIAMSPTEMDKAVLRVQPVGTEFYAEPTVGSLMTLRRLLGRAVSALDLLVLAFSVWVITRALRNRMLSLSRRELLVSGVFALVIALTLVPHLVTWFSQHRSLMVLSGGDDWLTYESFARDIRENSLLMLNGKPLGQADAFYYQPLYPYFLAIVHLLGGESPQGVILLQLLATGFVLVLAAMANPSGLLSSLSLVLVVLGTGIFAEWLLMAERLLSENLMMVLMAMLLFLVSRLRPVANPGQLALIGIVLGVAGLVRATAWTAVPLLLILLLRGAPRRALPMRLALVLVPIVLLASLVPIRNVVAAGTTASLPTSGSINLFIGNVPTGRNLTTEPWIELSKQYDARMVAVAEAVVNAPDQVAKKIADKAVYVLGFPRSMDADNPVVFWPVLALWILAGLGVLTTRHSRLEWTCLILAVTHALALVVVFPNNYYYRLMMPATLPLAIWDAIAVTSVLAGLPEPSWAGRQVKRLMFTPKRKETRGFA